MRRAISLSALATVLCAEPALAQRASENAVNSADDAFGSSVGLEQTGIYSEQDTRGFSPNKAGNGRIDGIYYDPVGALSARLRYGNTVRVGFAAEEYPFQAPTGIIEYRLRPFPKELGASVGYNLMAFGGYIRELDLRVPLKEGRVALLAGAATSDLRQIDGAKNVAVGFTGRVIARIGPAEFAPFVSWARFTENYARPLAIVRDDYLPEIPRKRRYFGQPWANGNYDNHQMGATLKTPLADGLSLRAGLFYAQGNRQENYSDIFVLASPAGLAGHRLIADPAHDLHSLSGEAQVAWRFGTGKVQHRLIAGFRGRNRVTETGGSDVLDLGVVRYGEPDPRPQPSFRFTEPNFGRVRQSSLMLGYLGRIEGVGRLNLGLQKARYRASFRDARTGVETLSRDDPWLYNATLGVDLTRTLSVYAGTQAGLEDSGVAPENATNRNEQLPATRTKQVEAGLRWKFAQGQVAANLFQITKPYFLFDAAGAFTRLGEVRHRGVELSMSGHFGPRFNLLAGAVLMQPRVTGEAIRQGLHGERPTGTPSVYAKVDANYRTDIFGGLTPTATLTYTGPRAAGSRPQASLGGRQLMVDGFAALDLGVRQQFRLGKVPASFRFVVLNVFDAASWKVVAPNTVYAEERRRINLTVTADF